MTTDRQIWAGLAKRRRPLRHRLQWGDLAAGLAIGVGAGLILAGVIGALTL